MRKMTYTHVVLRKYYRLPYGGWGLSGIGFIVKIVPHVYVRTAYRMKKHLREDSKV